PQRAGRSGPRIPCHQGRAATTRSTTHRPIVGGGRRERFPGPLPERRRPQGGARSIERRLPGHGAVGGAPGRRREPSPCRPPAVAPHLGVPSEPVVPIALVTLTVAGTLVVANVLAAFPALLAARTRPAEILRAE